MTASFRTAYAVNGDAPDTRVTTARPDEAFPARGWLNWNQPHGPSGWSGSAPRSSPDGPWSETRRTIGSGPALTTATFERCAAFCCSPKSVAEAAVESADG